MLCVERLCELPLEVRVLIANMDMKAYIRMYLYDSEFKNYANREYAIDYFIKRFVITYMDGYKKYKIGNFEYHKYVSGGRFWYNNNKLHRIDGPAAIYSNGDQRWYLNGKPHRIGGPAVICANGALGWYMDGKLHRGDGPAIIHINGSEEYYVHGVKMR